jgi:hypothetical protein
MTFPGNPPTRSVMFRDKGILGDETEITIEFEAGSEPKVTGGAPYQIIFDGRPVARR